MRAQSASTRIPIIPKPSLRQEREENVARLVRVLGQNPGSTEPQQVPPSSSGDARRYKSVVVCQTDGTMRCPECSLPFMKEDELRDHVFQCRIHHGVDPLLQLHVVKRRTSAAPLAASARASHAKKSSPWNGETAPSADLDILMRPIAFCVEQRNLMAPVRPRAVLPGVPRPSPPSQSLVVSRPSSRSPTADDEHSAGGTMEVLNLQGQCLTTNGVALIKSSLAPKRSRPVQIREIRIDECIFETDESERTFLQAVLSNQIVERITGAPAKRSKGLRSLWAEVEKHVASNADRAVHERNRREFGGKLDSYQRWGEEQRERRIELLNEASRCRDEIRMEERAARDALANDIVYTVNRQLAAERRQLLRLEKDQQRREFVEAEYAARCALLANAIGETTHICVLEEVGQRHAIFLDRERSKQIVWMTEREDVFRSKIREQCRFGYAALNRLRIESHHAAIATAIEQESVAELEALIRQRQRHRQHALWRRRKREEIELFFRAEKVTRDGIEKEEDNFFSTNREKLHRTIEMILAKYASQRESLSLLESNIRDLRENHFTQWFSLAVQRFYLEARVIRVYVSSMRREAHRRALLDVLPTAGIDGLETLRHVVMFCTATPSHDPPPGVPLFPSGAALRVTLPQEWTAQMQDAEAKCRASMAEEKLAMTESMQVLAEISKKLVDSRAVAFQLTIDELHRRLQQARLGASGSPSEADLMMPEQSLKMGKGTNRNATFRKVQSLASTPSEPVTEPNFLRAAPDLLRWRCAFADRSSVTSIRNSKERVQKAIIQLRITGSDCDDIAELHRMQLKSSSHAQICDGVVQDEPPDWDALSMDDSTIQPTETQPELQSSMVPGIRVVTGSEDSFRGLRRAPRKSPSDGAHHELLVEVDLPRADESPSVSGLENLSINPSMSQPRRSVAVPASQVTDALQSLTYRCLVDGKFSQLRRHAVVTVEYDITVEVAIKPCYGDASVEMDPYGYAPAVPRGTVRRIPLTVAGRIDVCVVPSFFTSSLGEPRLLVEKQMDEVPLLTAPTPLAPPFVARYEGETLLVEESTDAMAFGGGQCHVEVFTGSVSGAERLSIRDDLPAIRLDVTEKHRAITRILINGNAVAEVLSGTVQSTKFVTPSNAPEGVKPKFSLRFTPSCSLNDVKEVLQRMRFHDYEADPWEGRMVVRISLVAPGGCGVSVVDGQFDIEHIDKPTELRIAHPKLTFRAPMLSCPPLVKQHAANYFVRLFHQCVVFDEDTDMFGGGYIRVTMTNNVKGDAIAFVPDTHILSPVEEALQVPIVLSMSGEQVIFQGRVVATVTEGRVLTSREFPDDGATTLNLQLAGDDQCSIAAVQCMLRHIAFYSSNPPTNAKGHNVSQQRDISVDVQIMDNEQATKIHEVVSVRGAGHSIQLPEKAGNIEYKEGNPPTRFPNTDLSNDRIKPITTFAGGFILATVVDNFEQDIVTLRTDETEYRLQDSKAGSTPPSRSPSPSSRNLVLSGKIRAALAKDDAPPAMASVVDAATARKGTLDIVFTGMTTPLATVQQVQQGVLIQLLRDTKKDILARKHVVTLLRNLTYWTSNPRVSSKTIRICFSDDPAHTPSQALINVDLESIDDVTEIRMKSPRKRVLLQPPPLLYPLCPYGRCILYDADTDYFDGGQFTIQCASGSSKGDVFSLVLPSRQKETPVQRLGPPTEGFVLQAYPDLSIIDGKTFVLHEKEVGRVEFTSRDGGVAEVRLCFGSDGSGKLVSTALASYMINSVCYGNHSDKLKDTARQFLLRVRDSVNPIEGKLKISVDLAIPTIAFQNDSSQYISRVHIAPTPTTNVQPGSRIVVQSDPIESKNMVHPPGGTVEIFGAQKHKVQLSVHQLFFEELQLRRIDEDGRVLLKGGIEVMNITYPSPSCINFTFGQLTNPKPFVTRTVCQSMLRYVTVTVVEPLDVKAAPPPSTAVPAANNFFGVDAAVVQSLAPLGMDDSGMSSSIRADATPKARMQSRKSIVVPRTSRSSSMSMNSFVSQPAIGPEDDDDVNTLTLRWKLHDGQNLSTLVSYILPKAIS